MVGYSLSGRQIVQDDDDDEDEPPQVGSEDSDAESEGPPPLDGGAAGSESEGVPGLVDVSDEESGADINDLPGQVSDSDVTAEFPDLQSESDAGSDAGNFPGLAGASGGSSRATGCGLPGFLGSCRGRGTQLLRGRWHGVLQGMREAGGGMRCFAAAPPCAPACVLAFPAVARSPHTPPPLPLARNVQAQAGALIQTVTRTAAAAAAMQRSKPPRAPA